MKKLIAVILTLSLMLLCLPALAADYTAEGVGTFTLPDSMEIDNTSFTDENTADSLWLFSAYADDVSLECYNDYLDDYADVSLFSYSEDELNTYIEDTVVDLSTDDYPTTYLETVRAGQIPFLIYSMADDDGPYYYAETIANGWCINLVLYNEAGTLPEAELSTLRSILASFTPAI